MALGKRSQVRYMIAIFWVFLHVCGGLEDVVGAVRSWEGEGFGPCLNNTLPPSVKVSITHPVL